MKTYLLKWSLWFLNDLTGLKWVSNGSFEGSVQVIWCHLKRVSPCWNFQCSFYYIMTDHSIQNTVRAYAKTPNSIQRLQIQSSTWDFKPIGALISKVSCLSLIVKYETVWFSSKLLSPLTSQIHLHSMLEEFDYSILVLTFNHMIRDYSCVLC